MYHGDKIPGFPQARSLSLSALQAHAHHSDSCLMHPSIPTVVSRHLRSSKKAPAITPTPLGLRGATAVMDGAATSNG